MNGKQSTLESSILISSSTLLVGFISILLYHRYLPGTSLYNHLLLGWFFLLVVIGSSIWNTYTDDVLVSSLLLIYIGVLTSLVIRDSSKPILVTLKPLMSKNWVYKFRKFILVVYILYTLIFTGVVGWGVHLRIQNDKDTRELDQFRAVWRVLAVIFTSVVLCLSFAGIRKSKGVDLNSKGGDLNSKVDLLAFQFLLPRLVVPKIPVTKRVTQFSKTTSKTTKEPVSSSQDISINSKRSSNNDSVNGQS
jgi:hypothetical protein